MLELNRLQSSLSGRGGSNVHPGDLLKLGEYAAKAGRVDAQAYLAAHGDVDDEEWESQGERVREGDYCKAIEKSELILARHRGTVSREEAASAVCSHMRSSYLAGREAARTRSPNVAPGMRR